MMSPTDESSGRHQIFHQRFWPVISNLNVSPDGTSISFHVRAEPTAYTHVAEATDPGQLRPVRQQ
jgi:hypothetical protein